METTSDAMFGAFELETLSMALGLMTSLFTDKEKVRFYYPRGSMSETLPYPTISYPTVISLMLEQVSNIT